MKGGGGLIQGFTVIHLYISLFCTNTVNVTFALGVLVGTGVGTDKTTTMLKWGCCWKEGTKLDYYKVSCYC